MTSIKLRWLLAAIVAYWLILAGWAWDAGHSGMAGAFGFVAGLLLALAPYLTDGD